MISELDKFIASGEYSYFDFKALILTSRLDLGDLFSIYGIRLEITETLKKAKRDNKGKYKTSAHEAMHNCSLAEAEYAELKKQS